MNLTPEAKAEMIGTIETTNFNLDTMRLNNPPQEMKDCGCWLDMFLAQYTSEQLAAVVQIMPVFFTIGAANIGLDEFGKLMAHCDFLLHEREFTPAPVPTPEVSNGG